MDGSVRLAVATRGDRRSRRRDQRGDRAELLADVLSERGQRRIAADGAATTGTMPSGIAARILAAGGLVPYLRGAGMFEQPR
jgi:hypothetical protein